MRYLFGLGNPGPKYVDTRHNFGFLLLERVSGELAKSEWTLTEKKQHDGLAYWERWKGPDEAEITLVWPLTYMNLSGQAVDYFLAPLEDFDAGLDLLVAIDELSLPLGRMRLRKKGSSGGHNGLKSVESSLGHSHYPRFKLGIGRPESSEVVEHVLSPFGAEELEVVEEVLSAASDSALEWLKGADLGTVSSSANGWRSPTLEPKDPPRETAEPKSDCISGENGQVEESTVN